jgi:hypothetical protein
MMRKINRILANLFDQLVRIIIENSKQPAVAPVVIYRPTRSGAKLRRYKD